MLPFGWGNALSSQVLRLQQVIFVCLFGFQCPVTGLAPNLQSMRLKRGTGEGSGQVLFLALQLFYQVHCAVSLPCSHMACVICLVC